MRTLLITLSVAIALAAPGAASAGPADPWATLMSATFRILGALPGLTVNCTGWYAAPSGPASSGAVSVYVTAGHCPAPQIVLTTDGLEQTAVLARITRPGVDAAVGARFDPRSRRTFPRFAASLPNPGDRALVVGYSAGHLIEGVLTALPRCSYGFLCFHSSLALQPGMSGAPIMSLRTGEIVGILVAMPQDARTGDDPHTIMATPSASLRHLVELAAPGVLEAGRTTLGIPFLLEPLVAPSVRLHGATFDETT